MKIFSASLLAILTINLSEVDSLNVLGIFQYHGKSHFFVFQPYLQELAKRGHNVTVISHFPQKQPIQNYTDISLAGKKEIFEDIVDMEQDLWSSINLVKMVMNGILDNCRILVEDENVHNLIKSRTKFDLILVEAFVTDCALGVAYKLDAPVVALTTHMVLPVHYDRFGVPNPSLHIMPNPDFLTRLLLTVFQEFCIRRYWSYQHREQKIVEKNIGKVPPLEELGREVKLLLAYTHYSMIGPQIWPENIKEVGGYHVAKPKPLPEKLKEFIEQSEHGVIYVSFGSMVQSTSMPRHKLEAIVGALSELPQRVVWKWEEDYLPGNPKNIYIAKWLPQNDILAHPNVVAFYSHGGLLGSTEAIHHGVPAIVTPIFAEQPINAMALERKGLGVWMPYDELTKDALLEKFKTILDPEFRRRAKEISREWHDRPMSPMDSAIYWTEYAVRHPNSTLQSAAVGKPVYQLAGYDVLFTLYTLVFVCLYVLYLAVKFLIFGKRKSKKD